MKKSLLLSILSGLMLGLSFPLAVGSKDLLQGLPNGLLIFFALIPLFSAIDENPKFTFLKGFLCGFTFYSVTLFWITMAMILFGNMSVGASMGILLTLVLYMTLYLGLFAYLVNKLKTKIPLIILAPSLMVSLEIFRNYFLTGFPWANLGYALIDFKNLIQISDLAGTYCVTFLIVFVNVTVYEIIKYASKKRAYPKVESIACILLLLMSLIYGVVKIKSIENTKPTDSLNVTLVQGNIPQDEKWAPGRGTKILTKYFTLSELIKAKDKNLIVWPEASLPYSIDLNHKKIDFFERNIGGANFLVGGIAYERKGRVRKSYNTAFYLSLDGRILGYYHKTHLVPFSEHILYEKYIPFFRKIMPPIAGDFHEGNEIKLFKVKNKKFGVLICFEAIFPELSRKFARKGADFLLNITNDSWFGKTSGPYQHFDISVFRAIETRLPILRAANTGISAVILPTGKVLHKTKLFVDAAIEHEVKIKPVYSLYAKTGDLFAYACGLLIIVGLACSIFIRKKKT